MAPASKEHRNDPQGADERSRRDRDRDGEPARVDRPAGTSPAPQRGTQEREFAPWEDGERH